MQKIHNYTIGELLEIKSEDENNGIRLFVTACEYDVEGNLIYSLGLKPRGPQSRIITDFNDLNGIPETQLIPV